MHQVSTTLRERITLLSWALPVTFAFMVVLYELGPARWVHDNYSDPVHFGVEILFYATAGPLLTFWILKLIGRWLDEKDQAEKQARASERRLAAITSASADAILGLDVDACIESWNRGAELLFGYSTDDVRDQPASILFEGGAAAGVELQWLDETVRKDGFVRGHEAVCRDADGRVIDVEITATGLTDDQGIWMGMSVILRDITNRKRRQQEIQRLNASLNQQVAERTSELAQKIEELAQANAELQKLDQTRSEFVSLVSHQIRAPLTNMSGAVQRIQADCQIMQPTCVRMLAILEEQTDRLDRLVQGVLNTARLEAGELLLQPEPMSVLPVAQQVVEQTRARAANRPFHLADKPGLPLAFADRNRVSEVLANLLDNADKYSPPGEAVAIDVSANETQIIVSVRDAGPGLPPEQLKHVFDKFYRTDGSDSQAAYGYGLGLYVCRRLVEEQGGQIWAENHPDGGASFSFTLPVWQGVHE